MSIEETYVPFTRKPPPGKRKSTWWSGEILIGNGQAPAEFVLTAVPAVLRLDFNRGFLASL